MVFPESNSNFLKYVILLFYGSNIYFGNEVCFRSFRSVRYNTKNSTGSAEIDSLIDGIQVGSFYLFYSSHENQLLLDSILYRQLIGCILPKSQKKNGFESAALLCNNIDLSYEKNKHQLLNPEKIAITSK